MTGVRRLPAGRLALAMLALAACEPPAGADGGLVVDLATLPELSLVEAVRLGGPEAPEEQLFATPPVAAIGADGTLHLLDRPEGEVRSFDRDGVFLGRFGGQGDGPGEFRFASAIGRIGDSLWVRNASPPNLELFDGDGGYLGRRTIENPTIGPTGMPVGPERLLRGGVLLQRVPGPPGGAPARVPLLLVGSDATDTVAGVVEPAGFHLPGVGGLAVAVDPPSPLYAVTADGAALVLAAWSDLVPGEVIVTRHDALGGAATHDTLRFDPVPLEPADADSMVAAALVQVEAVAERVRAQAGPDAITLPDDLEGAVADALGLGATLPPVRALLAGANGTLWLERPLAPGRSEWVVLDPDGRPEARVTLPLGHILLAVDDARVWTLTRDDLDVVYVVGFAPQPDR